MSMVNHGSPLRAGKPRLTARGMRSRWAHPCACRETPTEADITWSGMGSPLRVQGNPVLTPGDFRVIRLTPARAGKPRCRTLSPQQSMAHPCACRETADVAQGLLESKGSPLRVQGNHADAVATPDDLGLTPARAGKPRSSCCSSRPKRAHPCACRETSGSTTMPLWCRGSPLRVQGNHTMHNNDTAKSGLTPARAGKP